MNHMKRPNITVRLRPDQIAFLDAVAAHLAAERPYDNFPGRSRAIEQLIAGYRPPSDLTPTAAAVRKAFHELTR